MNNVNNISVSVRAAIDLAVRCLRRCGVFSVDTYNEVFRLYCGVSHFVPSEHHNKVMEVFERGRPIGKCMYYGTKEALSEVLNDVYWLPNSDFVPQEDR